MRELLPGILTWHWFSQRFGYDFNGYLVRDGSGNLAVDPVEMSDATLDELARLGVARIVLTNRNHFRDAAKLRARTGARVAVHAADAAFVREKGVIVDEELAFDAPVGPFIAVDAHGKSPGEIALYWRARRLLLVGDAVVGPRPGECGLLPAAVIDDAAALRASLRRLADLDFDALLLADGHPIPTGGREALRTLVATFEQR